MSGQRMNEHLSHDLRPYDPELVLRVQEIFKQSDSVVHQIMSKLVELEHEL